MALSGGEWEVSESGEREAYPAPKMVIFVILVGALCVNGEMPRCWKIAEFVLSFRIVACSKLGTYR
jgi:hypothetical protein